MIPRPLLLLSVFVAIISGNLCAPAAASLHPSMKGYEGSRPTKGVRDDQQGSTEHSASVLIVGSGVSGLAAAASLTAQGISVLLIEAHDWQGGRLKNVEFEGIRIELGGNWVHGGSNNEILWPLVQKNNLKGAVSTYSNNTHFVDFNKLTGTRTHINETLKEKWKVNMMSAFEKCHSMVLKAEDVELSFPSSTIRDIPVSKCLEDVGYWSSLEQSPDPDLERRIGSYLAWELVSFSDTVEAEEASTRETFGYSDKFIDDDLDYFVTDSRGYVSLFTDQVDSSLVHLNTEVEEIIYTDDKVTVNSVRRNSNGTTTSVVYTAAAVIVTVPLGVLKTINQPNPALTFAPPLPPIKLEAIESSVFGNYGKVYVKLSDDFNESAEIVKISQYNISESLLPFAINLSLDKYFPGSNVINFHMTGSACREVEEASDTIIKVMIENVLTVIYGVANTPRVLSIAKTNWSVDRFFRGSYSTFSLERGSELVENLGAPVGNSLFFAGEHTYEDAGYVHGAYDSGLRAASEVIAVLTGRLVKQE